MSTSLTPGSYLTGSAYNGGTARTFNVDATDANTPSKIVARDASGNFSAGTITASMSTSLTPGSYLTGSAYNGGTARTFNVDATDANTPSKIVARDASGDFSAGTITATSISGPLSGNADTATALETARTIALTGDVTGSATFDGSGNISISTTSSGGGMIAQFVSAQVHNKVAYGFVSSEHISPLDISIAPQFSNSKIYLTWRIEYEAHRDMVFRIYRNSTLIGYNTVTGDEQWSGVTTSVQDNNLYTTPEQSMITWIDSPNTTSTVTYKVYIQKSDTNNQNYQSFYLNRTLGHSGANEYENGVSQKTAMEISQ